MKIGMAALIERRSPAVKLLGFDVGHLVENGQKLFAAAACCALLRLGDLDRFPVQLLSTLTLMLIGFL